MREHHRNVVFEHGFVPCRHGHGEQRLDRDHHQYFCAVPGQCHAPVHERRLLDSDIELHASIPATSAAASSSSAAIGCMRQHDRNVEQFAGHRLQWCDRNGK
jgi:hypothetical protein